VIVTQQSNLDEIKTVIKKWARNVLSQKDKVKISD